jgi:hypothetical protein
LAARLYAPFRRPLLAVCGLALILGVGACGRVLDPPTAENNGVYVEAGPITYQLQVSRLLNQYSTEDSQYVKGLSPSEAKLNSSELWYGVFLWAKNQGNRAAKTTDNFDIVDTLGNTYYPVHLNSTLNPYAWSAQTLAPGETQPGPDTPASYGPTQGELVLFKMNESIYSNRPLTLQIRSPSNGKVWARISLDL